MSKMHYFSKKIFKIRQALGDLRLSAPSAP